MGLESRINKVWNLLMDKQVGIIGIYGKGGVGKTFLLKQIYKKLAISPYDFDIVIWITVSERFSVRKMQDEIWKGIGVFDAKWVEKSFDEKAKAIRHVLCEKKFVLFLDDTWRTLDFTELGVPKGNNESKVLLTSRYENVCREMGAQKIMALQVLDDESAWELFKKMVGEDILNDPKIHHLASLVAPECRGLPLLICTVARALARRITYDEWEDASKQVKLQDPSVEWEDMRLSRLLNFCFDSLPSDSVKTCFLYYCLFPEDFTILQNDLIDFWICEQLLRHDDANKDVLNLGYNTIDALIGAYLLEEEEENYIKLQDLIRDIGLSAAIFQFQMLEGAQLIEDLETVGWIASMPNSIRNFANVPYDLLTFLLNHNPFIIIKGEFSQFMYALTVLDLSYSGIEEVPAGISELVSLQYLNLSHTWIEYLPVDFNKLAKLKCLNLEHNNLLRIITRQLISGLSSLEVLKMFRCGFSVEQLEDNIMSIKNMDVDPLLCLEHLKVLSITITCASALQKFFSNPKLPSCTQSLSLEVFWGSKWLNISPLVAMKNLLTLEIHQAEDLKDLTMDYGCLHSSEVLKERCFERLREVSVEKCSSLCDLTWLILAPNVKVLRVKSCEQMEEIISTGRLGEILNAENLKPFVKLESLIVESLPELKSIYWKPLPLQCLQKIQVTDCSLLKKLPLCFDSANKKEMVIEAEEEWWKKVDWEDDATKATFLPCFKPLLN